MKRFRKLFGFLLLSFVFLVGFLLLSFVFLGTGIAGGLFGTNNTNKNASADFETYDSISNDLPDYFKVNLPNDQSEAVGFVGNTIYLFQTNSYIDVKIATNEISKTVDDRTYKNYAYIPDAENQDEYYYFDFQNSLSLYYNLTNQQIADGQTGVNLIQSQSTANYAKPYENDSTTYPDAFTPTNYNFTPLQLDIKFTLSTSMAFNNNEIQLAQEGCYTLVVPLVYYYTENGGATFTSSEKLLYYTFMVFNASTYFDAATGYQNLTPSSNMQVSSTTSTSFSRYYFYNYSYAAEENTISSLTYNPKAYQLKIDFTDIDSSLCSTTLEYKEQPTKVIVQKDANGDVLSEEDSFVATKINNDDNITVYFRDIGTYDISFTYLYKSIDLDASTEITYTLPLEQLASSTPDASIFKNKNQRVYIYGYQARFSDYSSVNPTTNQPESVEFKSYDYTTGKYYASADITSSVNNYIKANNPALASELQLNLKNPNTTNGLDDISSLKAAIQDYINHNQGNVSPVSTNQTPVRFLNNVTLKANSYIFNVTDENNISQSVFEGFNQNTAGTYIYIIQYTYDSFMSESGTLQAANYHYQIFYFTVTSSTPRVTIVDENFDDIYTAAFTNKSVYILNDAENNIYDAKVTVLLSAFNYNTGRPYFQDIDIKNLSTFSINYQQFPIDHQPPNSNYKEKIAGKWGVKINIDSNYANANYVVKIYSANTNKPSIKTFTIDTNDITGIKARNVSFSTNTTYKIGETLSSYNTNCPIVLSWDNKKSGANTYGYIKFIPTKQINYYGQTEEGVLSTLLDYLIRENNTLPVSYTIDFNNATSWSEYKNTNEFDSTVSANYVKSEDGFYLLEVYDQAGNSNFEIFFIDKTSPMFVLFTSTQTDNLRKIMGAGEIISVPESVEDGSTHIKVQWTENKAFYLENLTDSTFTGENFKAYKYSKDSDAATEKLKTLLTNFFDLTQNTNIKVFDNLGSITTTGIGIDDYNGQYLTVPINSQFYLQTANPTENDGIKSKPEYEYEYPITFIDSDHKAIEGTYSIFVRDESNNKLTSYNIETRYKNASSGFISFNVTSDASKMGIRYDEDGSNLKWAAYNLTGKLYTKEGVEGYEYYTTEQGYSATGPSYKFSYYTPVPQQSLNLSFYPVPKNSATIDKVTIKYYPYIKTNGNYYTLSDTPEGDELVIYDSENSNYPEDEILTWPISLTNNGLPKTGKYVIERSYKESEIAQIDKYDYFRRIITFIVDEYGLITSLETTQTYIETTDTVNSQNFQNYFILDEQSNTYLVPSEYKDDVVYYERNLSLGSLVGRDIVLSLYSDKLDQDNSIEIAFPKLLENGLTEGSFYTKESFDSEEEIANTSVSGNKLPMALYIPKYKYTIGYSKNTAYSVSNNNTLSFYGNPKIVEENNLFYIYIEGIKIPDESFLNPEDAQNYLLQQNTAAIQQYQIYAKITVTLRDNSGKAIGTKYYQTNGSTSKGYLRIYECDKDGNITSTEEVKTFTQTGSYNVSLYQASADGNTNKFYSFYNFSFEITSNEPDFEIVNEDGYALNGPKGTNEYYTNSKTLTIQWQDPQSEYEAKIDQDNIYVYISGRANPVKITNITSNNGVNSFNFNCDDLVEVAGSSLRIVMQYEGYNSAYYRKVEKTVKFDISAPIENLKNLMTLTENSTVVLTKNYQQFYMRSYVDYQNRNVSSNDSRLSFDNFSISYSYSATTEPFSYFSYNVTEDYFYNTLKTTMANASRNLYDTQSIYYKPISNIDTYPSQQARKDSFSKNEYTPIEADFNETINSGYYEIVELDYAGNMVVYLVYVINDENTAIEYTNNTLTNNVEITDKEIVNGYNIYSKSGFTLIDNNYKSDPWQLFYVQISGRNEVRYMKSPRLNENEVYKVTISNKLELTTVNISSIFAGVASSNNKHSITLSDRTTGERKQVYLSIMDATLNIYKVEDPLKTSAILNIYVPTEEQQGSTTRSYVYPVKVNIYQFDSTRTGVDDKWVEKMEVTQEVYGTWVAKEAYADDFGNSITFTNLGTILQIKVSLGANASQKIKYEILDNFGTVTPIIQLANEVSYKEISGDSTVYSLVESNGDVTYISTDSIYFRYNNLLYSVSLFTVENGEETEYAGVPETERNNSTISFYKLSKPTDVKQFDNLYKVVIKDVETNDLIKTLYVRLYSQLPFTAYEIDDVADGGILFNDKNQEPLINFEYITSRTITFDGNEYTAPVTGITTYSRNVTLFYPDGRFDKTTLHHYTDQYGYRVYISKDNGLSWEDINIDASATSGYTISGEGEYLIFIRYNTDEILTDSFLIYRVIIKNSAASYYYITVDGVEVTKSDMKYKDRQNIEYQTNYIVGIDINDKANRLRVIPNQELEVVISTPSLELTGTNVYVEIYEYSCKESTGSFTIIYINVDENDSIVSLFTYETSSGATTSLKSSTSEFIAANKETEGNFSKLKLNFSSYYGIEQNQIKIIVQKLFNDKYVDIYPTVYKNDNNSYIYLSRAGSYRIKLSDSCTPSHYQYFKTNDCIDLIFLNSTPITVTYTDIEKQEEVTTEFVQKAVYNSSVKISLNNLTTYYQPSGYPVISVKHNGVEYNKATSSKPGYVAGNNEYTFTEPGYYSVVFSATTTTGIQLREEEFNFTIINPNESRYAYEFTNYENYYMLDVIKDSDHILHDLMDIGNFDIVIIDGYFAMTNLTLNFLDEKTGGGRYRIYISPNDYAYVNTIGEYFCFDLWINMANPPITVSVAEGEKTTGNITIKFNVQNLYNAVGDCYLVTGGKTRYYTKDTISSYGEMETITLSSTGTHFVQLYTAGGQLLYSYKVVKTEPLNSFAILAIVLAVVVVAAIVIITVRLRKRQKTK